MQVLKRGMKQTCSSQLKRQKARTQRNISNNTGPTSTGGLDILKNHMRITGEMLINAIDLKA